MPFTFIFAIYFYRDLMVAIKEQIIQRSSHFAMKLHDSIVTWLIRIMI